MNILKTTFILILIGASTFAQQKAAPSDESNWVRFESPARDFSVSLPEMGYLVDSDEGSYRIHYISGEIVIKLDMTPKSKAKDDFKLSAQIEEEKGYIFTETGDFLISQFIGKDKQKNMTTVGFHLASSKGSYLITASTKDLSNINFIRFLDSIHLNGTALYIPRNRYPIDSKTILVSSLKSDTVILEALQKPDSKQKKLEKARNVTDEKDNDRFNYTRPLILLRKPKVVVDSAWGRVISGTLRVRVTFLANGEIGNVVLLNSVDEALDKSAFNAAKKIKFLPAEIDGKAVDVTRVIEYSFLRYSSKRG